MYLLDTNVISELKKVQHGRADRSVATWAAGVDQSLFFYSAINLFELKYGLLKLERTDPLQAAPLRSWLESTFLPEAAGRILPVDAEVANVCAELHVPDRKPDRDAFIAATAVFHGLVLVTRNTRHFTGMNLRVLDRGCTDQS